jgi:hypothetical protein
MFRSTELSFLMDAAEKDNWDPGKKKETHWLHDLHSHIIQLHVPTSWQKWFHYGQKLFLVKIGTCFTIPQLMFFYDRPVT